MKHFILRFYVVIGLCIFSQIAYSQGCVAIRSFSGCGGVKRSNAILAKKNLMIGTNFRYFKSFRHFRGPHEEPHRVEEGTQVINKSSFIDLTMNYGITNRLYANITVPFVVHNRSSMYEHGGNPPKGLGERHTTTSSGLADIRLGFGYWLFDPDQVSGLNYAIGAGVKLPTGKWNYTGTFYNHGENNNETIEAVVDQSIQPGDGSTGIYLEAQGYHILSNHFSVNTSLYYMAGVRELREVSTIRGSSSFSCADQYMARLGINYMTSLQSLGLYLGGRIEGVPSSDLIGGDRGFRRPGYVISVEPGVNLAINNFTLNLSLPVALKRARVQNYSDKVTTQETGVYKVGDAAFADYLINFGITYHFHNRTTMSEPDMKMMN